MESKDEDVEMEVEVDGNKESYDVEINNKMAFEYFKEYIEGHDNNNNNNNKSKTSKSSLNNNKSMNIKGGKQSNNQNFLDYFEAFRLKDEFLISENPEIKNYDFTIDSYSSLMKSLPKEFLTSLNNKTLPEEMEKINSINQDNLFEWMIELLTINSNIFLYGFGSKLKLVYDFLTYFQTNYQTQKYHFWIFNCYNPEMNFKVITSEWCNYLVSFLEIRFELFGLEKHLTKNNTIDEKIQVIDSWIKNWIKKGVDDKYLLVLNNIDGPNFTNKFFQKYLSKLRKSNENINILASCDNVNLPYLWTQNIKGDFKFYFLKYHTFNRYDLEISEMNSLNGEKSIKTGFGWDEIWKSFTAAQKKLLKVIAELQWNNEFDKLTIKGIWDYLIDGGFGICNNQNKFNELIGESIDHEIVQKKVYSGNNKEIYRLNLDKEIVEKIAKGDYDNKD